AVKTRLNIKTRITGSNEPFLEVFARETSQLNNNNALANFPSFEHIRDSSRRLKNQIGSYIPSAFLNDSVGASEHTSWV
ncbi:hypothetical protein HZS_6786, partial [Henneguya salminicola]